MHRKSYCFLKGDATMPMFQWLGISVLTLMLSGGFAVSALAQAGPGGGSPGLSTSPGGARGAVRVRGHVVCVQCTLDQAKALRPDAGDLYELRSDQAQFVMQLAAVHNSTSQNDNELYGRWEEIAQPPQLAIRADHEVVEQLLAPANRTKEFELTGVLRPSRTFDIATVHVLG
jgi:hypothetical protein